MAVGEPLMLLVLVVVTILLEVDAVLVPIEDMSLPTADGPSVLPSRACAACLILSAVSPVSPEMLKRSE